MYVLQENPFRRRSNKNETDISQQCDQYKYNVEEQSL